MIGYRMTARAAAAATLSVLLTAGEARAADVCPGPEAQSEGSVAAMQQELMVAALYCNATVRYNRFVAAYRSALQEADQRLQFYFRQDDPRDGLAAYNAFKTKLANVASLRSISDVGAYCRAAQSVFDAALGPHVPLTQLASDQPAVLDVAPETCAR